MVQLTATQLSSHLQKPLMPCYVVAGEEPLLMNEAQDAIRQAARDQGFSEREILETDRDFSWPKLLELCATGSLFSARRLIELRLNTEPGKEGDLILRQLAESAPDDVLLLVITGRVDPRVRKSGWYAVLERSGAAFYAWPMRANEFRPWLVRRLHAAGLELDADVLDLLVQRTEGNLLAAAQEVMKLSLLHPGGELDITTTALEVVDSAHYGILDWIDSMLAGDDGAAVRRFMRLREEGEPLPLLVTVLALELNKLALVVGGVEPGHAGVFHIRRKVFVEARHRVRPRQVHSWLVRLAQIDFQSKTGSEVAAWESMLGLAMAIAGIRRRSLQPRQRA